MELYLLHYDTMGFILGASFDIEALKELANRNNVTPLVWEIASDDMNPDCHGLPLALDGDSADTCAYFISRQSLVGKTLTEEQQLAIPNNGVHFGKRVSFEAHNQPTVLLRFHETQYGIDLDDARTLLVDIAQAVCTAETYLETNSRCEDADESA